MRNILVRKTNKNTLLFPDCIYQLKSQVVYNKYFYYRVIKHNLYGIGFLKRIK